jgi:inner membrane protein
VDPVSQASLGALAAQVSNPRRFVAASWAGAAAGFLPDADVLIRSSTDPLLFLEYHRHFTHSLAFVPIGGALVAWAGARLSRGRVRFDELWLPATLGWATHGLLDACTSYGTYLFWPFSDARIAWHVISIVDPLFTLPLLFGVVLALRRRSTHVARIVGAVAMAYIGLCATQLNRATAFYEGVIAERKHEGSGMQLKPSLGNNILFRAFYEHEGAYHVDAIRMPWIGEARLYPGDAHPVLDIEEYVERHGLGERHQSDLRRFEYFSAGYLIEDPRHAGVISDFRYAAVPNDIAPLWGIEVLNTPSDQHTPWLHFREMRQQEQVAFWHQLRGR